MIDPLALYVGAVLLGVHALACWLWWQVAGHQAVDAQAQERDRQLALHYRNRSDARRAAR